MIFKPPPIPSSEITPEQVYRQRRRLIAGSGLAMAGWLLNPGRMIPAARAEEPGDRWNTRELDYQPASAEGQKRGYYTPEKLTPYRDVTHYNNFYEFGTSKSDPSQHAWRMKTDPWSVTISGEVARPGTYTLEDLLRGQQLEERIYRLRCVEAWSMVIPWVGFELGSLLRRFEPTSKARYVQFTTLYDPDQMPGQRSFFSTIDWPYQEGLRMDEAMHPLTLMVVGLYGRTVPPPNGAPLRLIVPWKYGFKSIKSIVRIHLSENRSLTSWEKAAGHEYGFYANVNPKVDHPRWSQATERRLPSGLFSVQRIPTRMFNGYAEQVADLYTGMDLRRFY